METGGGGAFSMEPGVQAGESWQVRGEGGGSLAGGTLDHPAVGWRGAMEVYGF